MSHTKFTHKTLLSISTKHKLILIPARRWLFFLTVNFDDISGQGISLERKQITAKEKNKEDKYLQ